MDDPQALRLAGDFANFWNEMFDSHRHYILDFSWPSVGVVDLILVPLRGQAALSEHEDTMVRGASAYLAQVVYACWRAFSPDLSVTVSAHERPTFDIVVEARGGEFLSNAERSSVNLYSALRKVLASPSAPLGVIDTHTRTIAPQGNLLSPFMLGLCLGRSPLLSGSWYNISLERYGPYLFSAGYYLSESCAEHARKVFLLDSALHDAELYARHLLLPPLGYDEPFHAMRAVSGFFDYCRSCMLAEQAVQQIARRLSTSPDENLAAVGTAVSLAFAEIPISAELTSIAHAYRGFLPSLRRAVIFARRLLRKPADWCEMLETSSDVTTSQTLYDIEQQLGLIPLAILPPSCLSDAKLQEFFFFIANNEPAAAFKTLLIYTGFTEPKPEIKLQIVHLAALSGNISTAEQWLAAISAQELSDPHEQFFFYYLKARLCERARDVDAALAYYRRAQLSTARITPEHRDAIVSLCSQALAQNNPEECLRIADAYLALSAGFLPAHSARIFAHMHMEDEEAVIENLNELYRLAPQSERLFAMLRTQLLAKAAFPGR